MTSPIGEAVVCDASPLIVLARVDQLELLEQLFSRVSFRLPYGLR